MIDLSSIKPGDILVQTEGNISIVLEIEPFSSLKNRIYVKILHKSRGIRAGVLVNTDPYTVISC